MNTELLKKLLPAQKHIKLKQYLNAHNTLDSLTNDENTSELERNTITLEKGIVFFKEKKWKEAINCFQLIDTNNIKHHKYIFHLAETLKKLGKNQDAEKHYALALSYHPLNDTYLNSYINITAHKRQETRDKRQETRDISQA